MAEHLTVPRGMPERAYKEMGVGFTDRAVTVTVAADSTRGQYRAIKRAVKQAYGRTT